jgi:AMMECR1 domain-containing protein
VKSYTVEEAKGLIETARLGLELQSINEEFDDSLIERGHESQATGKAMVRLLYGPTRTVVGTSAVQDEPMPVSRAVVVAAASAMEHAGSRSITQKHLDQIIIELSIMSEPVALSDNPKRREIAIQGGKYGVMLEYGSRRSYVVPAHISGKSTVELLDHACTGAGLPPKHWTQPKVNLYKFEVQSFIEREPNGEVIRA